MTLDVSCSVDGPPQRDRNGPYSQGGRRGKLVGRWPEAISRWASRGAEMRMGSEDFSADFERLDQTLAAGRRVGGKKPKNL